MTHRSQTSMKNSMVVFIIYKPLDFKHLPSVEDQSSITALTKTPNRVFSTVSTIASRLSLASGHQFMKLKFMGITAPLHFTGSKSQILKHCK